MAGFRPDVFSSLSSQPKLDCEPLFAHTFSNPHTSSQSSHKSSSSAVSSQRSRPASVRTERASRSNSRASSRYTTSTAFGERPSSRTTQVDRKGKGSLSSQTSGLLSSRVSTRTEIDLLNQCVSPSMDTKNHNVFRFVYSDAVRRALTKHYNMAAETAIVTSGPAKDSILKDLEVDVAGLYDIYHYLNTDRVITARDNERRLHDLSVSMRKQSKDKIRSNDTSGVELTPRDRKQSAASRGRRNSATSSKRTLKNMR